MDQIYNVERRKYGISIKENQKCVFAKANQIRARQKFELKEEFKIIPAGGLWKNKENGTEWRRMNGR